jgi:BlaI family transcriptional regulator, penicillinase repressor
VVDGNDTLSYGCRVGDDCLSYAGCLAFQPGICLVQLTDRHRNHTLKPLANAELSVMELLWRQPALTARQLRDQLYPDSDKAQHGTVQRLLQRLEEKGFVGRDREQTPHLFHAAIGREDYAGRQLESLTEKLTGGSLAPLITHLIDNKKISRDEINRLRQLLDDHSGVGE